ncbi:polycystic kidney disease protein 1-like 2 [Perca fluviatilis]|uniref:polycystic kidney disease protein 1-like 2 n=1 Tax=Perca fluviatilis TaxID=8168 RepID=UPI0019648AAD|nr:polycystic kidney disease protein 1-like 2 [Perca fluviatilis]
MCHAASVCCDRSLRCPPVLHCSKTSLDRQDTLKKADFQKAFGGSCYEFVDLQHTFYSAQAWCEQRGGHLAFIPDEETQYFLKRFLDPKNDVWLGVAPSASPNLQYSPIVEGALFWLDGSHITYSNWVSSPQLGAACGHILRDSGFQWEATRDCNQKRQFICQFDSGRSIVCAGRNATLQCGSHQVLMIDVGFYGRENIHYCRSTPSPPSTSTEQQCGWVDVVASLTAHCHGRQVCQISEVVDSLGDPCPQLGSYLSVDYHCKDGLTLSVSTVAAVFEIIPISVKWLFHLPQGNLSCMLSTGDGHVIYLHSPEGLERSEVHSYTYPSTFVVAVECTSRDIYIRAQNIITIEEPITVFGAIRCYARKRSFHATNCKVLYREPFQIQMEVKAGTNVTYRIQSDETLLSNVSVFRGNVPQNVTVTPEMMKQLGPGCHQLTLYASNTVTIPEMSAGLQLREKMLNVMIDAVSETPINTPGEVQVIATGLAAIVLKGTELSSSAQKNISDALLLAMSNTQSALLAFKEVNGGPTIIQEAHIAVFVNRVTPGSLHTESIYIPNSSSPTFSLPILLSTILPSDEPVDVRMLSFNKNPFSWNESGNISGQIGALSLTTKDGSSIPVENLSEDIKILLLSPVGEQVNTSMLDLGNSSTTSIHIPADTTLVLKMVPSNDPLPFKLLLGYMDYPTVTNNVAMTEMPHQGTTQEERYTWLLDPKDLKGKTGMHYLVVRPIVGPGIKSINATLSITSITTACKFWDESKLEWSTYGCRVGVQTTPLVTQCLCNHLTSFGSSFFVTPNLVDPSRTAELFGTFAENPVVVCFVGSLFLAYLLVLVWARRKDIQDTAKVKVTVLEDNDPMDEYRYLLSVNTGHRRGASTSSQVTITLLGAEGNSEPHHLTDPKKCVFERGAVDLFLLTTPFSLGELQGIRLWHNNSGSHPAWYVGNVMVQDLQTEQKWHFLCNSWLAIDMGDCSLDKILPVSTEMDLKRFSNLFFMKTTKDFGDRHLWYSVISRPPSSTFTCVQRVSCCFTLLLCTMLTSIMFYGIPKDPSEQTMDLGHFEFTWQQFKIGVQSSLIMFPINILIVTIFRNTRPRETSCCKRKTEKPEALEQTFFSQTASTDMNVNVTLDTVIKDITRIAHSLSKTVKSNIPCTESKFGPGQPVDINAVLSVVEDFIKQNHKASDTAQPKTLSSGNLVQPQLPAEEIQKQSNKAKYLYRQLCHIDKELILLGPSGFPAPHSYSQAMQQVQDMKGHLQDQLFTFSCVNPDELPQKKLSPADSTEGGGSLKKRGCCHGGLPWWFVFVGWLLVISSSFVAGFFTMLYGLKFGKERSVSWLVSMIISFFQSIFVIQPLKVLCLAVFFALVTKKIDEEDFQNVAFEGNDRNLGCKDQKLVRRERSLYEPPPPADVEKMRRNMIMEQKAFALLKEILTYMGFMWMLLLVAYGQRDPNAFFLKQHIRDSFSGGISDNMSLGDVFTWANTSLLSNLFGVYPGFITDGNSKLVGNARLRQLRVQKNSCQTAGPMLQFVPDCQAAYSWEVEDMGSYGPGWSQSAKDNISMSTNSPWTYQTQAQLRAHAVWGTLALYRGGGFVTELGPDSQNASSTLEYLFRNTWLDIYTRAIFVEFTVYNANVNLFCIVTLFLETTAVGAFQFTTELHSVRLYQSPDGLYILVMAAEIVYLLFIVYYMFLQGQLMKQQRWAYFRSRWNLLELTIILLSWSAVAVFIKRTLLGNRDMTYYQNHKEKFASFYDTGKADSTLQYLIAFLVLPATFKLWHLLRLNPKMNLMTAALQRAWSDITNYLVIIVIMLLAYSITCNVLYGWQLSSYRTWLDALITIISLQIGIFNYDEVIDCNPVLSGLIIGSCIVFMTFVVLNLFVSVIIIAFKQERIYHKPSDEEEIVDLMLEKICGLFGIRYNDPKDTLGPDVKRGREVGLNNSRNIHN